MVENRVMLGARRALDKGLACEARTPTAHTSLTSRRQCMLKNAAPSWLVASWESGRCFESTAPPGPRESSSQFRNEPLKASVMMRAKS
jgi:hypothetical protein